MDAIDQDFGHRSSHETRLAELYVVAAEARYARRHVARWMRQRACRYAVAALAGVKHTTDARNRAVWSA